MRHLIFLFFLSFGITSYVLAKANFKSIPTFDIGTVNVKALANYKSQGKDRWIDNRGNIIEVIKQHKKIKRVKVKLHNPLKIETVASNKKFVLVGSDANSRHSAEIIFVGIAQEGVIYELKRNHNIISVTYVKPWKDSRKVNAVDTIFKDLYTIKRGRR